MYKWSIAWCLQPSDKVMTSEGVVLHQGHLGNRQLCTEHSGPLHSGPLHSGPLHSGPLHSGPLHSGPLHSGPLHSGPLHSGPLHSGPLHSGPLHSGPLLLTPSGTPSTIRLGKDIPLYMTTFHVDPQQEGDCVTLSLTYAARTQVVRCSPCQIATADSPVTVELL